MQYKVYCLLLKYDDVIQYGICPVKQRLVWRKNKYSRTPPWIRHGLFPSILECCRTTNQEGSVVLYGGNWFQIERWKSDSGRRNLDSVTKLRLSYASWDICAQDHKVPEMLDLLPGIREVSLCLADLSAEEWKAFLAEASGKLERIRKVTLHINISQREGMRFYSFVKYH